MPLDAFGALGLHEKNAYLQALADTFCARTGRETLSRQTRSASPSKRSVMRSSSTSANPISSARWSLSCRRR